MSAGVSAWAAAVKSAVTPRALAERSGLALDRQGYARCPFHAEKTASFRVYDNGFYCFGCHAHGSVIDLAMRLFGLSFPQAVAQLNRDFALGLPVGERLPWAVRQQARRAALERKQAQREREDARLAAERVYWREYDRALFLTRLRDAYRPTDPLAPIPDGYAYAVRELPQQLDRLSHAEEGRYIAWKQQP